MGTRQRVVAVIGAGPTGLVAVKECLEAGLKVECFEKSTDVGGMWKYTPVDPMSGEKVHSSIYHGLVLNSMRDTMGFSDFPYDPARHRTDYFGHPLHLRYLGEYADRFGLREHIRFETEVLECRPNDGARDDGLLREGDAAMNANNVSKEEESKGLWTMRVRKVWSGTTDHTDDSVEDIQFDAIICAHGGFSQPKLPDAKGLDTFKGQIVHSHYYRTPGPYEGKRVAVIGFGDSAVDIACELGPQSKEMHIVARRTGWVLPKYFMGKPLEAWNDRSSQTWIPHSVSNAVEIRLFRLTQPLLPPSLRPSHKIVSQNPVIRSDFTEKVLTGVVTPHRASLESVSEHAIHLSNGETLEVDVVFLCTGYHTESIPFLPADAVASRDAPAPHVDLYKQVVSPHYRGLYVMGLLNLFGPHIPSAEAQARYVAAMEAGVLARPGRDEMLADVKRLRSWRAETFLGSDTHYFTVYPVRYIDDLLGPLGCRPSLGKLLARFVKGGNGPVTAAKLLLAVYFGPVLGAHWRLYGHGQKPELALSSILRVAAGEAELTAVEKESVLQRPPEP